MRWRGMPVTRFVVLSCWMYLLLALPAGLAGGCAASAASAKPAAPRPLGLPDDFDLEADGRRVRQPAGGGGVIVDRVQLSLRNRSDRPRVLKVTDVERLHGSCEALGWDDIRTLTLRAPAGPVQVGAGEALGLMVTFDPVECQNACDRFGFRVHIELDGTPVVVDSLLEVERDDAGR
jgi:hypothetical protein